MRLIPDALKALSTSRLAEGDPLPPEDRVVTGSILALEDLYHAQAPRLLRFFARRADRQDANDLVQESFARLADTRSSPVPRIGSMTTLDVTTRYRVAPGTPLGGLEFTLSVQNLLNAKPDPITTAIPYDTPYDSTNYSPVGRLIALGITRTW